VEADPDEAEVDALLHPVRCGRQLPLDARERRGDVEVLREPARDAPGEELPPGAAGKLLAAVHPPHPQRLGDGRMHEHASDELVDQGRVRERLEECARLLLGERRRIDQHAREDARLVVARRPQLEAEPVVRPERLREATDLAEQHAEDVVPGAIAHVALAHLLIALSLEMLHHLGQRHRLRHASLLEGGLLPSQGSVDGAHSA
jgi:hypothetical protein